MNAKGKIEQILTEKLNIQELRVIDDSLSHAGHNPAAAQGGTHFNVYIVSDNFNGKSLVQRHRMVNDALKEEFKENLHALALKTLTPSEAEN